MGGSTPPPIFDRLTVLYSRHAEQPDPLHTTSEGSAMLRFQTPLSAAAREIVVYCLRVAADEIVDLYEDHEAWAAAYPLASACFTQELARSTLLDVLDKLDVPEEYVPTNYHWLLIYECLKEQLALFNDAPVPSVMTRLRTLARDQDTAYLHFPTRSNGTVGVWMDFDEFVDVYFWDTDFLTDVGLSDHLAPDAKQQLGRSEEVFGVTHGFAPHPDELIFKRWPGDGTGEGTRQERSDDGSHG
jgi:hypothetical protein